MALSSEQKSEIERNITRCLRHTNWSYTPWFTWRGDSLVVNGNLSFLRGARLYDEHIVTINGSIKIETALAFSSETEAIIELKSLRSISDSIYIPFKSKLIVPELSYIEGSCHLTYGASMIAPNLQTILGLLRIVSDGPTIATEIALEKLESVGSLDLARIGNVKFSSLHTTHEGISIYDCKDISFPKLASIASASTDDRSPELHIVGGHLSNMELELPGLTILDYWTQVQSAILILPNLTGGVKGLMNLDSHATVILPVACKPDEKNYIFISSQANVFYLEED